MKPATQEVPEHVTQLRQQLILAQVRIMELEDMRDTLTPRLDQLENLLRSAQQLADRSVDESSHAQRVLLESQAQAAALQSQLTLAAQDLALKTSALEELASHRVRLEEQLATLESNLATERSRHADTTARLEALLSSRSWRWTAWLRALLDRT